MNCSGVYLEADAAVLPALRETLTPFPGVAVRHEVATPASVGDLSGRAIDVLKVDIDSSAPRGGNFSVLSLCHPLRDFSRCRPVYFMRF